MANISSLDAVKIQTRAVLPIVKALEKRIGKKEAHKLVGDALADAWANFVVSRSASMTHPRDSGSLGFPVETVIARDSSNEYAINMVECAYADYFKGIGEPEIGALITCGVDYAVERRMRPGWEFARTQTLMQGADHCDFCWRKKPSAD